MKEIRCTACSKMLGRLEKGTVEIKCSRCKKINLVTASELPTRTPRVSLLQGATHAKTDTKTTGLSRSFKNYRR